MSQFDGPSIDPALLLLTTSPNRNTQQYTSVVSVTPGSALCLTADLQEFWSSRPGIGPPTYPPVGHGEETGVYEH
jgi:hypothetical protein